MTIRPSPRGGGALVLFLSFSVFMTSLLAMLLLAACATRVDPISDADVADASEFESLYETPVAPAPGTAPDEIAQSEGPFVGVEEQVVVGSGASALLVRANTSAIAFDAVQISRAGPSKRPRIRGTLFGKMASTDGMPPVMPPNVVDWNTERYDEATEAGFVKPQDNPLSTFSIDVDTASYANVRRFLRDDMRPPAGAVRIEELVNYFRYPSRVEQGDHPFSVETEIFDAPWRKEHRLVRVAVEGRDLAPDAVPPRNLVFLLDVSGSMQGPDRLDLVKYGLARLTESLRPIDHVSIVVYAGASGVVLPPTSGRDEEKIVSALLRLSAGGSTAGAEGIRLAYATARKNFDKEGINRVILATDGDFNVGVTSRSELIDLIEEERKSGIFLTVLGVGRGNLNDAGMEQLADRGNGNYAYIDSRAEARKVLVEQANATLVTIAKDVKIQVEFNPKRVKAYRLIGYENRRLADQDFNDDTKDAGEIGAGHHVTALYEVVPVGASGGVVGAGVDPLKYQAPQELTTAAANGEWLTVKLRYKAPNEDESRLVAATLSGQPGRIRAASENARFSTAVALFGMLLRDSEFIGAGSYGLVEKLAGGALGQDEHGERREFLKLVERAQRL